MAGKSQFSVHLDETERKYLVSLKRKKSTSSEIKTRCSILLEADENRHKKRTRKTISAKTGACETTVRKVIRDCCEKGAAQAVCPQRSKNSDSANLIADGEFEARALALACSKPPEGRSRWTLKLLADSLTVVLGRSVSASTVCRTLKRNLVKPHLTEYWCIPPKEDADFVAAMEDILDVYQGHYDEKHQLWCEDEKPYQLLDHVRRPLPVRPKSPRKEDSEYVREGTASIFCFVRPDTGKILANVNQTRTAQDWAHQMKWLVDQAAPEAEKITLVVDNLNVHKISALYKTFEPEEARRIARKLDIHYTPIHGSWLNIAEAAISVMAKECLKQRIPGIEELKRQLEKWQADHNRNARKIDWQFTCEKARVKLKSLYPNLKKGKTDDQESSEIEEKEASLVSKNSQKSPFPKD